MDSMQYNDNVDVEAMAQYQAQVAHDIQSPLASLNMFVASCEELQPRDRSILVAIAKHLTNISNSILCHYSQRIKCSNAPTTISCMQLIEQVLELKQLEYKNTQVKFNFEVTSGSSSCYIHANVTSLMRMLSNLINNAVEALDNKLGIITIKLESNINAVNIIVEDNGKGMTAEVKNKILNNIAITHGKANGHGIGLTQVREALVQANGKLAISSEPGMGTKVSLTFPRLNVAA